MRAKQERSAGSAVRRPEQVPELTAEYLAPPPNETCKIFREILEKSDCVAKLYDQVITCQPVVKAFRRSQAQLRVLTADRFSLRLFEVLSVVDDQPLKDLLVINYKNRTLAIIDVTALESPRVLSIRHEPPRELLADLDRMIQAKLEHKSTRSIGINATI